VFLSAASPAKLDDAGRTRCKDDHAAQGGGDE
jgi:hypothetical protein